MAITLSGDGITSANIAADGIDGSKIADDAVSTDHLANSINTEIAANTAKTGITSAQATAITAALPKAGGTMSGTITSTHATALQLTNNTVNKIHFGDSGNASIGKIEYVHSSNHLAFKVNDAERLRITSAGKVGIGVTAPAELLHVESAANSTKIRIKNTKSGDTTGAELEMVNEDGGWQLGTGRGSLHAGEDTDFHIYGNGTRMWIKRSNGSAYFANNIHAGDGISFNGETDAAHLLDDYEEGIWSPTITGASGSYGLDNSANSAAYTKIGRTVTCQGHLSVTADNSASGNLKMSLPFTPASMGDDQEYAFAHLHLGNTGTTTAGQKQLFILAGGAYLHNVTDGGVVSYLTHTAVDANWQMGFSFTYIVQ